MLLEAGGVGQGELVLEVAGVGGCWEVAGVGGSWEEAGIGGNWGAAGAGGNWSDLSGGLDEEGELGFGVAVAFALLGGFFRYMLFPSYRIYMLHKEARTGRLSIKVRVSRTFINKLFRRAKRGE